MVYSSVGDFAMMRRFSKSNKNKEKLKGKKGGEGWGGGGGARAGGCCLFSGSKRQVWD